MWDRSVITDKHIPANRPDIILINETDTVTYLIDIAVRNKNNLMKTYSEKVNKYQELAEEIKRMWKQEEVNIVPLTLSNTGIIPKHLFTSILSINIPRNTFIEMQKQAVLSICRLTRKVFNQK
jgi:hypothetical protein